MSRHPVVAVTATSLSDRGRARIRLNEAYADALSDARIIPLVVPPLDPRQAPAVVAGVEGIVLTGGEDVDPALYGAPRHHTVEEVQAARDAFELALVAAARAAGRPTLAICRGLQLANVALGGTLVQDLPSERPSSITHARSAEREDRVHEVSVVPGSRL
ncbi:MAG TPA: gamma-glutamyl-gamma-aminobutyrate hydrolase family protein, partial [Gemmatimonadaceae bacterium]|nr:gamma-glutamyl-gamma-aminobutyrate hydrolase family protein [Gemmatimonadaceae bacterium]